MATGEEPPLVRELKRGTAGHVAAAHRPPWFMEGGKYSRPLKLFTYVFSSVAALSIAVYAFPEKDKAGRDHVFSPLRRFVDRKVDEFFDIKQDEIKESHVSEPN